MCPFTTFAHWKPALDLYAKYAGLLLGPDPNDLAKAMLDWMRGAITDPPTLSCVLISSHLHLGLLQGTFHKYDPEILSRKALVYQRIRQDICKDDTASELSTIYMIMSLALTNDSTNSSRMHQGYAPFKPPYTSLQWLNIYGAAVPLPVHTKAIAEVVKKRGGINGLQAYGLDKAIS